MSEFLEHGERRIDDAWTWAVGAADLILEVVPFVRTVWRLAKLVPCLFYAASCPFGGADLGSAVICLVWCPPSQRRMWPGGYCNS